MSKVFVIGLFLLKSNLLSGQNLMTSDDHIFATSFEQKAFNKGDLNHCDPLLFLLAADPKYDSVYYIQRKLELLEYAASLQTKKAKNGLDARFLQTVFHQIHRKYLRTYIYPAPFANLLDKGHYNCLSAVALYSYLLNLLGYSVDIYETRLHLFLLVELGDSTRLMYETTDPINGFVENMDEITQRIRTYMTIEQQQLASGSILAPPFDSKPLLRKIDLKKLAGLHYYNFAVNALNEQDEINAAKALSKARLLYPNSERIEQLLDLTDILHKNELSTSLN